MRKLKKDHQDWHGSLPKIVIVTDVEGGVRAVYSNHKKITVEVQEVDYTGPFHEVQELNYPEVDEMGE